ncbi:hypothetical protein ABFX02_13G013500 [Erythranthe guttata]
MFASKTRLVVLFMTAILVCSVIVREVGAESCDPLLSKEICTDGPTPKTDGGVSIHAVHRDSEDDNDDDTFKKLEDNDQDNDDDDDDNPEVVVLGH